MATVQNINFVQYGRRKGKEKEKQQENLSYQESAAGMYLPDGTDLRQVTVLRRDVYNRLKDGLTAKQRAHEQAMKERLEKQKYHAEAKELVKQWPNTILGERKKKLTAKKLREEAEEKERQKIDLQEAQYQAECRKKAIEEARTKQYYQTDRVRGFHGALLLTECLKERECQVELNKAKQARGKDPDELKRMREQLAKELAEEKERQVLKAKERKLCQSYQIDQWKEREKEAELKNEAEMKEGQRLRHLHQLYEMEQQKLKELKKTTQKETKKSLDRCLEHKNAYKALEKERNDEEDEEIRIFAETKRKLNKMRHDKDMRLKKEKSDKISKMAAHVQKFYDEFDARIRTGEDYIAADEAERVEQREKEKIAKKKAMIQAIKDYRKKTLAEVEQMEQEEKKSNRESLRRRREIDAAAMKEDQLKKAEKLRRAKNFQTYHRAQINLRAENERQERAFDVLAEDRLQEQLKKDEQQFYEYTSQVIEDAKSRGRNVYPLVKAARSGFGVGHGPVFVEKGVVRPSYLTADWDGKEMPSINGVSTIEVKGITDGGEAGGAKKRLGFVW